MTGIKLNHIPYRSASQAVIDLAEGRIDITFGTLGSSLPLIKDGKIKLLAVSTARRASQVPGHSDHCRSRRAGLRDLALVCAGGAAEPADADRRPAQPRAQRHHRRIPRSRRGSTCRRRSRSRSTLQGMADLIRTDLTRWREIAAKAGVKGE